MERTMQYHTYGLRDLLEVHLGMRPTALTFMRPIQCTCMSGDVAAEGH